MVPENFTALTTGLFNPSFRFAKVIALRAADSAVGARIQRLSDDMCCMFTLHKFLDVAFGINPPDVGGL